MHNLLNFIFPPKCIFCKKESTSVFCINCLEKCQLMENPNYKILSQSGGRVINVFSPFEYDGIVRECIKTSKYGPRQFLALKILTKLAVEYSSRMGLKYSDFTVVPIPLNIRKMRTRGFNQAEIVAKGLAKRYKLRICETLLTRNVNTQAQYQNGREQRFKNVQNAFRAAKATTGQKILIVDDIFTTGATVREATNTLFSSGAKEIAVFTLSRSI